MFHVLEKGAGAGLGGFGGFGGLGAGRELQPLPPSPAPATSAQCPGQSAVPKLAAPPSCPQGSFLGSPGSEDSPLVPTLL